MKTWPSLFRFLLILAFLGGAFPCVADPHWSWLKGDKTQHASGVYGTQGRAGAENRPGVRYGAATWTDPDGRLWLFGGYGRDASGAAGFLCDLWLYDPASGQWTWIKGVSWVNQHGAYDEPGVASPGSMPGARTRAACWADDSGRLWLFGGEGYGASGGPGKLGDLWRFDLASGIWTWVKGPSTVNPAGVYGSRGVAAATNSPGARDGAAAWTFDGRWLWLFGGHGCDASGAAGYLNDLWRLDTVTGNWAWIQGPDEGDQKGAYGTQGYSAPANGPGARYRAAAWVDGSRRLLLFGGYGLDGAGAVGRLNDLWRFDLATGEWTWLKGSPTHSQPGVYGTRGAAAAANAPGARYDGAALKDGAGRLWLLGGDGLGASGPGGALGDLWRLDPVSGGWTWVDWAWVKGPAAIRQSGVYGAPGVAAPANAPGSRAGAAAWTDGAGRLVFFGGLGCDAAGSAEHLNDLWRFDPASGDWAWLAGSPTVSLNGVYGTQRVAAAANLPGGRSDAAAWSDAAGRLWLFGGWGDGAAAAKGDLNDLWRFDPAAGKWAWVKGSSAPRQRGVYGKPGVAAPANTPGARCGGAAWSDGAGRLWLFGGNGRDAAGAWSWLSDLWRFEPATSEWTWVKGSDRVDQPGVYGTLDAPAAANAPGARDHAASWTDGAGRLWLFGGYGLDATGATGRLSDLWRFDVATGEWAWVKGASVANQDGVYGAAGAPGGAPGGRCKAAAWRDAVGRLWLFGGCAGPLDAGICLNDLWRFDPSTGEWTWVKGSSAINQLGVYGTQGVEAASNAPGARGGAVCWTDEAGRLWLCGGYGLGDSGTAGALADLWRFDPSTNCWTWLGGAKSVNQPGGYGAPGARRGAVAWSGGWRRAWLLGGLGRDAAGVRCELNDFWSLDLTTAVGAQTWDDYR